jgi:hypothetical protein
MSGRRAIFYALMLAGALFAPLSLRAAAPETVTPATVPFDFVSIGFQCSVKHEGAAITIYSDGHLEYPHMPAGRKLMLTEDQMARLIKAVYDSHYFLVADMYEDSPKFCRQPGASESITAFTAMSVSDVPRRIGIYNPEISPCDDLKKRVAGFEKALRDIVNEIPALTGMWRTMAKEAGAQCGLR